MNTNTKSLFKHAVLAFILLFIMLSVSQTIGLGRTGFDSQSVLMQFFFYAGPGIGFLVAVLLVYFASYLFKADDAKYGNSVAFASPAEYPALNLKIFKNQTGLALLTFVIMLSIGLFTLLTKQTYTSFTGVGVLKQQFAFLDSALFSSALVPASENLGLAFIIALTIFGVRYFGYKNNMSRESFMIYSIFLVTIVSGLYGLFNHLLRYGNSDIALFNVVVFWALGGLITIITGSFIPFWIIHIVNNFLVDMSQYYANDIIIITNIIAIVILSLIYYTVFYRNINKKESSKTI